MQMTEAATGVGNHRLVISNSGNINSLNSDFSSARAPSNSEGASQLISQFQDRRQIKKQTSRGSIPQSNSASNDADDQRAYFSRNRDRIDLTRISEENHTAANSSATSKRASEISETHPSSLSKISRVQDNSLSQFFNKEELLLLNMKFE